MSDKDVPLAVQKAIANKESEIITMMHQNSWCNKCSFKTSIGDEGLSN